MGFLKAWAWTLNIFVYYWTLLAVFIDSIGRLGKVIHWKLCKILKFNPIIMQDIKI